MEKGELEGMCNEKKKSDVHVKRELSEIEVKQERKANFYAEKKKDIRKALLLRQPILILVYKESYLSSNDVDPSFPSSFVSLS